MIVVEADVGKEWPAGTDWQRIAERAAGAAVAASGRGALAGGALRVEVSVKFTGDSQVQALNAAYRDKPKPTNVLSFPMVEPELLDSIARDDGEILLGDVVLAHGVCAAEAGDKGLEAHAAHLVVHGVLHLLGYDHENDEGKAEAMERVERDALAAIGISDPYAAESQTETT